MGITNLVSDTDVSVVIPSYNMAHLISRCVSSIQSDQEVKISIIIIDDGSQDNTQDILYTFDDRVWWEAQRNQGACVARNRGLELVRSPYVMFLDADDCLLPGTVGALVSVMQSSEADIVFSPVYDAESSGISTLRGFPRIDTIGNFLSDWLAGCFIPPCGILWRTSFIRQIGGWNTKLSKNQDGELIVRAIMHDAQVTRSNQGGAVYWNHDSSDRISNSVSETKLLDSFGVFRKLHEQLAVKGDLNAELELSFSYATHSLERMAARNQLERTQDIISRYRKNCGWPRYVGQPLHVITSRFLGLSRKEVLAKYIRKIIKRSHKLGPQV